MYVISSHPGTDDVMLEPKVLEVRRQPEVHELHVGAFLSLVCQDVVQLQVSMLNNRNSIGVWEMR